jgi:hypothetical protein
MGPDHLLIAFLLFIALLLLGCGPKEAPDPIVVPDSVGTEELPILNACEFPQHGSKTKSDTK